MITVAEVIIVDVSINSASVVNVLMVSVSMVGVARLMAVSMNVVGAVVIAIVDSSDDETLVVVGEPSDVCSSVESDHDVGDFVDAADVVVDTSVERFNCMDSDDVDVVEDDGIAFEAKLIPAEDRVPVNESIK